MCRITSLRRTVAGLCAFALALALLPAPPAGAHAPDDAIGRVLVKFRAGTPASAVAAAHARMGGVELRTIPRLGVRVVQLPRGVEARKVARRYASDPWVEFAEIDALVSADLVPNDALYQGQWGLPAVSAPQAWDITRGSSGVVVAVLDTGIDATHPDLARRVISGYDLVNRDADASDDNGHGTLVAGIVGADTDNALGVAGVDWAARLMPVKVLDASGSGYMSTVAEGIVWAADRGAGIINMSLSGTTGTTTLKSACEYAYAKGVALVGAAGNDGTDLPRYPAAYDSVISVGSLSGEVRSSYSSYGATLELMAPGGLIYTTQRGGGYVRASGTSMAAPFVSGLAALMRAVDPAISPTRLRDVLASTATDLGAAGWDPEYGWGRIDMAKALTALGGNPPQEPEPLPVIDPQPPADTSAPRVAIKSPADGATVSGKVTVAVDATDDTAVTKVELYVNGKLMTTLNTAPYLYVWNIRKLRGAYTLEARAYDAAGNRGSSPPITIMIVK